MPVRWDLRTGTVEVLDIGGVARPGAQGPAVAVSASGDVVIGAPTPMVRRDGHPSTLPVPVDGAVAHLTAIRDDGTVIAGFTERQLSDGAEPERTPVVALLNDQPPASSAFAPPCVGGVPARNAARRPGYGHP